MTDVRYVDPADCGCTDCVTGVAVPLQNATYEHLLGVMFNKIRSRLDSDAVITLSVRFDLKPDEYDGGVSEFLRDNLEVSDGVVIDVNGREFRP